MLSEVFLDKYEKENRVIELHLAGTLLIQTFKDCPEISSGSVEHIMVAL